jgi:hypothetical protein
MKPQPRPVRDPHSHIHRVLRTQQGCNGLPVAWRPYAEFVTRHVPHRIPSFLTAPGLPPGELELKLGCPLILLRNLSPPRGLCNGTQLIFMRMLTRVLEVKTLIKMFPGKPRPAFRIVAYQ